MTLRKDSLNIGQPGEQTLKSLVKHMPLARDAKEVVVNRPRLDDDGKPVGTRMERRIAKAQLRKHHGKD